jgi:hypothetical protein
MVPGGIIRVGNSDFSRRILLERARFMEPGRRFGSLVSREFHHLTIRWLQAQPIVQFGLFR